jgi:hypothetical protein
MTVFLTVWFSMAALIVAAIIAKWSQRRQRGPLFPVVGRDQILYRESFGSGRSLKNTFTQYMAANNCLKLTVTADELWVVPFFPFDVLANLMDLEHRIRKRDIITLHEQSNWLVGRRLTIEYRQDDGQVRRIEIKPSRYEPFKQALLAGTLVAIQ